MQIGNRHAGAAFPLTTQFAVPGERDEEQAVAFTARAFPVFDMELDLELPIANDHWFLSTVVIKN